MSEQFNSESDYSNDSYAKNQATDGKPAKLSKEETLRFISEIRKRRYLWDSSSKDYQNSRIVDGAWKEISYMYKDVETAEPKYGIKQLKRKWANLRTAYNLVKKTVKSDDEGRTPKLFYYRKMAFLNALPSALKRDIVISAETSNAIEEVDVLDIIKMEPEPETSVPEPPQEPETQVQQEEIKVKSGLTEADEIWCKYLLHRMHLMPELEKEIFKSEVSLMAERIVLAQMKKELAALNQ